MFPPKRCAVSTKEEEEECREVKVEVEKRVRVVVGRRPPDAEQEGKGKRRACER